jgi:hypothetical protein
VTLIHVALLVVAQVAANPQAEQQKAKSLTALRQFVADTALLKDDKKVLQSLDGLSKKIADDQWPVVEQFAVSDEATEFRWPLAQLLVDRKEVKRAGRVITKALVEDQGDRRYHLWKWWEFLYGNRNDYKDMSWDLTDELLDQFGRGNYDCKLAIAEVFKKGEEEAKLGVEEFKKLLDYDAKKAKWQESKKQAAK